MKNAFLEKLKEALTSILPVVVIVLVLSFTPLITIQLLGFRAVMERQLKSRIAQRKIISAEDDQIINFM